MVTYLLNSIPKVPPVACLCTILSGFTASSFRSARQDLADSIAPPSERSRCLRQGILKGMVGLKRTQRLPKLPVMPTRRALEQDPRCPPAPAGGCPSLFAVGQAEGSQLHAAALSFCELLHAPT